ncbi:serine hydrolase [Paenibacillus sp. 1P07SE]|uniref:serine hydrolase n=1 Tax=Paenibacillus sp. 1P07SE TaxID=3132209 RepID=UPI0039A75ACB
MLIYAPTAKPRSLWTKTAAALLLSLSLVASSVQAAAPEPPVQAEAQALTPETAKTFLDQFFAAEHVQPHFTGAAVSIVKDGEVIAQEGYGLSDVKQNEGVDPASTVFRVASVSKSFTAVAIMQLAEQGKLDLQADFLDYTPGLALDNPFPEPVTVEHLLLHTSGFEIRDPKPEDIHDDFEKIVTIEDYVRQHMPPVVREPGSSYMYDNFASLLLGLIVQNVSGEPFEDYMDTYVFEPLGMENSSYLLEGSLKDNLAVGYAGEEALPLYTISPTPMPHGGMLSTAEDIGKFMIAFLNGGEGESGRILSEASVALMEPYRSEIHPLLPDTTYGFEAPIQLPGAGSNPAIITKAGDLNGFSSYLFFIPEQETGVFITYNQNSILRNLFYPEFIATFFPQYMAPVELAAFEPESAETLARYDGYYADLRIRAFITRLQSGENAGALQVASALLGEGALRQVDDTLFVDETTGLFTAFKLDEQGNVAYMKEPLINPMGYVQKGQEPAGFADLEADHPYAYAILPLQSLGYYPNDASQSFEPDRAVSRAEYLMNLLIASNLDGSPATDYAFADISGHPAAPYIQLAYELGMVTGDGKGSFSPDRPVTRQEAAVMSWRLLVMQYPAELFDEVPLSGKTDEWAVQAVQMMVALGLHGPEVTLAEDGAADFRSRDSLTRAQDAAMLYAMFTQPTDHIVAAMMEEAGEQEEAA